MFKIGEIANSVGISVRALRYYHKIGILEPSERTKAGYRLYSSEDLERLKKIKLMRDLGFKLNKIKDYLERPDYNLSKLIRSKIKEIEKEIQFNKKLYERLKTIERQLEEQPESLNNIDHVLNYHFGESMESIKEDEYNVLLIDDVQMETKIWEQALKLENINFITTYSAKKALELLEDYEIHFIATDYIMPEMDGLEFIRHIKNHPDYSHIPIIIISQDDEIDQKVSDDEVVGVFPKPFNPARVKELIHKHVLDE